MSGAGTISAAAVLASTLAQSSHRSNAPGLDHRHALMERHQRAVGAGVTMEAVSSSSPFGPIHGSHTPANATGAPDGVPVKRPLALARASAIRKTRPPEPDSAAVSSRCANGGLVDHRLGPRVDQQPEACGSLTQAGSKPQRTSAKCRLPSSRCTIAIDCVGATL